MVGNALSCTFALQNQIRNSPVTVASIVVNGLGFTGPYGVTTPLTLAARTSRVVLGHFHATLRSHLYRLAGHHNTDLHAAATDPNPTG